MYDRAPISLYLHPHLVTIWPHLFIHSSVCPIPQWIISYFNKQKNAYFKNHYDLIHLLRNFLHPLPYNPAFNNPKAEGFKTLWKKEITLVPNI